MDMDGPLRGYADYQIRLNEECRCIVVVDFWVGFYLRMDFIMFYFLTVLMWARNSFGRAGNNSDRKKILFCT